MNGWENKEIFENKETQGEDEKKNEQGRRTSLTPLIHIMILIFSYTFYFVPTICSFVMLS